MDNYTPGMSDRLIQYLDGELSGTEKENFEKELNTNKILQDDLESLKLTREAIKLYGLNQKVAGSMVCFMKTLFCV